MLTSAFRALPSLCLWQAFSGRQIWELISAQTQMVHNWVPTPSTSVEDNALQAKRPSPSARSKGQVVLRRAIPASPAASLHVTIHLRQAHRQYLQAHRQHRRRQVQFRLRLLLQPQLVGSVALAVVTVVIVRVAGVAPVKLNALAAAMDSGVRHK